MMTGFRLLIAGLVLAWLGSAAVADPGEVWIDVRSVEEYGAGHIPGHPNIPHEDIAARIGEVTTDKNAPIRLYCRSGRRSGLAEESLKQLGYTNVSNAGGIEDVRQQLTADAEDSCAQAGKC